MSIRNLPVRQNSIYSINPMGIQTSSVFISGLTRISCRNYFGSRRRPWRHLLDIGRGDQYLLLAELPCKREQKNKKQCE